MLNTGRCHDDNCDYDHIDQDEDDNEDNNEGNNEDKNEENNEDVNEDNDNEDNDENDDIGKHESSAPHTNLPKTRVPCVTQRVEYWSCCPVMERTY